MKILVAYTSKTGGTRSMVELLRKELPNHEVHTVDISVEEPNPADYDYVVLGGAIRFGKLPRPARRYLAHHSPAIVGMPHTLFLCCAMGDYFESFAERAFSRALRESSDDIIYFGGQMDPSKCTGYERILMKHMRRSVVESEDEDVALPGLLPEHVRMLAARLKQKT